MLLPVPPVVYLELVVNAVQIRKLSRSDSLYPINPVCRPLVDPRWFVDNSPRKIGPGGLSNAVLSNMARLVPVAAHRTRTLEAAGLFLKGRRVFSALNTPEHPSCRFNVNPGSTNCRSCLLCKIQLAQHEFSGRASRPFYGSMNPKINGNACAGLCQPLRNRKSCSQVAMQAEATRSLHVRAKRNKQTSA